MNIHHRHSSPQCTEKREKHRHKNRSLNTSDDNISDDVQIILIDNLKYDYQKVFFLILVRRGVRYKKYKN
jgi:hypothetical protein